MLPVLFFQCSTPVCQSMRRQPKSCFRENQLLQGSISFSLQPTSHPRVLNGSTVRASSAISGTFTLLMGSSPCFGSYACYKRAIHTRFPFDSSLAALVMRGTHKLASSFFNRHAVEIYPACAGTSSTLCKHMVSDLFHSPHRGSFHLSLTVLVHYRSHMIFSLTQ